jgi:hypothetical protein
MDKIWDITGHGADKSLGNAVGRLQLQISSKSCSSAFLPTSVDYSSVHSRISN